MLFSCSAPPTPPLPSSPFLSSLPSFFPLFSPLILKKCLSHPLMGLCYLRKRNTHTHIQTDEEHGHTHTRTHTHTHIYTNGHRGRERTFDSSEMVDLLMAVTVRRHGWLTWTQPHLSFSRSFFFFFFLPLYRGQMFTGSYQRPKNDIQTGCEGGKKKKTDTGRDRGKDVRSNNGEKARDNSGIDRLPVGDTILCVNKKKKKSLLQIHSQS